MDFSRFEFRLNNMQRGVTFVSRKIFNQRVQRYINKYQKNIVQYETNIRIREEYALISLCRDKVLEEYLHSKRYRMNNIGVLVNPFLYAPKAAVLFFYSKEAVSVDIKVESAQKNTVYRDKVSRKRYHRISITGLESGENEIRLKFYNSQGQKIKEKQIHIFMFDTCEMAPNPIVKSELKAKSAFPHIFITGGDVNPFVFNTNGSIMHHMKFKQFRTSTYGVYPFSRNKFLWPIRNVGAPSFANPHACLLYEMDFMGRIKKTYHIKHGIHHFVLEMPNGNFLTCSSSCENYSSIKEGHTEDILVEIERETGNIVRKVYLKDIFGDKFIDQVDWVHANYLEYNEKEDSLTICMRNIHSVIKINWTTLEVQWLLSLPELWEDTKLKDKLLVPQGEVHYSFQAHAAYEVKDYKYAQEGYRYYLIFDNHRLNRRPIEGQSEDKNSYINIYAINEAELKVKQEKHLRIDMSIVRSNARYDGESNRLFNMSGCMWRSYTDYRGRVEEYDYESEELLNRWCILEDYFSAYEFEWKSDDYCEPYGMDENYNYECGEADCFVPCEVSAPFTGEMIDQEYFYKPFLEDHYMYFYTKDHTIDSLLLVGEKNTYEHNYTDTWQVEKIHVNRTYYCVLTLEGLVADTYRVKVQREGKIYDTEYYIKIMN